VNRHERRAQEAQQSKNLARANARLKTHMSDAYRSLDDGLLDAALRSTAEGHPPVCEKGCAYCCDQLVVGMMVEAEYIVQRYPRVVAEVAPELMRQEDEMQRSGVEDLRILAEGPEAIAKQKFLDRWFAKRIPCAFLDPLTKECRVYDARPIACRSHYAVQPNPKDCDVRPTEDTVGAPPVMTPLYIDDALAAAPGVSLVEHERRPQQLIMGPLQTLVLYAFQGTR